MFAVIGSGLLVFISVTIVAVLFVMREKQEKKAKTVGKEEEIEDNNKPLVILGSVFVENLKQAIDFDVVVKATLKDSNKISNVTFSTIYKA